MGSMSPEPPPIETLGNWAVFILDPDLNLDI